MNALVGFARKKICAVGRRQLPHDFELLSSGWPGFHKGLKQRLTFEGEGNRDGIIDLIG